MKDKDVSIIYQKCLKDSTDRLKNVSCCQAGWEKNTITGLNGWVFENLVAHLVKQEIPSVSIEAQTPLYKRAKVDLLVNNKIAIETKVAGVYSMDYINKLKEYRKIATNKGWDYLYISLGEGYERYYEETTKAVGTENTFFLDREKEDWNRFIERIRKLMKSKHLS